MKTLNRFAFAAIIISVFLFGCKKNTSSTTPTGALGANYPTVLNTIVTPAILDTLKKHGTIINSGIVPPSINGIYLFSPNLCIYDNSIDRYTGSLFSDYEFRFSNQNTSQFTVNTDYKAVNSGAVDNGSANSSTYVSGNGNFFTVYSQTTGTLSGVSYKSLDVYSGEIQSNSIKNFQHTLYFESKGADPGGLLTVAGTIRIFVDRDLSSPGQTTFTIDPAKIQINGKSLGAVSATPN